MNKKELSITQNELAHALTEWDRRFHEEPERFEDEVSLLLLTASDQYGQVCASYLLKIIEESRLKINLPRYEII